MKRPYYIQRLNAPTKTINPFSFGGGLVNGGLSTEGMATIKSLFSFDYMGSAEFEWGAIPTALTELANAKLTTTTIDDKIFIIAPETIIEEVKEWVMNASVEEPRLKEYLGLKRALAKEKYANTLGWLKIEDDKHCSEPWMFFIDKQMFENVCQLLGISVAA